MFVMLKITNLKARLVLLSASVEAWLLSFLSSAEARRASRQRVTTLVIHILFVSKAAAAACKKGTEGKTQG